MELIRVPAPPRQAFNNGRKPSDLIRAQVHHLKHLEDKMTAQQRSAIPQHGIATEQDAAVYIAAMTKLLRSQPVAVAPAAPTPISSAKTQTPSSKSKPLALAAVADQSKPQTKTKTATRTKKGKK